MSIWITVENFSSFQRHIEVFDLECNRNAVNKRMNRWDKISVPICADGRHGKIKFRADDDSIWTEVSLIKEPAKDIEDDINDLQDEIDKLLGKDKEKPKHCP